MNIGSRHIHRRLDDPTLLKFKRKSIMPDTTPGQQFAADAADRRRNAPAQDGWQEGGTGRGQKPMKVPSQHGDGASGSANSAAKPGDVDGGLSTGVIHNAVQEENIRDKALGGGVITNDDVHSYLGHLANDNVLRRGHNFVGEGKRKVGKAAVTGLAMKGYKKLPGSAVPEMGASTYEHHTNEYIRSPLGRYTDPGVGNKKTIEGAENDNRGHKTYGSAGTVNGPAVAPVRKGGNAQQARGMADNSTAIGQSASVPGPSRDVKSDMALSERHHRESIRFNESHAAEHEKEAAKHRAALAKLTGKRK